MSTAASTTTKKIALAVAGAVCFALVFWMSARVSGEVLAPKSSPQALSDANAPLEAELIDLTSDADPPAAPAAPGWKEHESSGLKIAFSLPKDFIPDTQAEQFVVYLNYDADTLKPGDPYSPGSTRVEIEAYGKDKSQSIADYLMGFTSSSTNVERTETTIAGLPALYETGEDGGPYAFYFINRGETMLQLRVYGSQSDIAANQELVKGLAQSLVLR